MLNSPQTHHTCASSAQDVYTAFRNASFGRDGKRVLSITAAKKQNGSGGSAIRSRDKSGKLLKKITSSSSWQPSS
jgi:hypothetical protein